MVDAMAEELCTLAQNLTDEAKTEVSTRQSMSWLTVGI